MNVFLVKAATIVSDIFKLKQKYLGAILLDILLTGISKATRLGVPLIFLPPIDSVPESEDEEDCRYYLLL